MDYIRKGFWLRGERPENSKKSQSGDTLIPLVRLIQTP